MDDMEFSKLERVDSPDEIQNLLSGLSAMTQKTNYYTTIYNEYIKAQGLFFEKFSFESNCWSSEFYQKDLIRGYDFIPCAFMDERIPLIDRIKAYANFANEVFNREDILKSIEEAVEEHHETDKKIGEISISVNVNIMGNDIDIIPFLKDSISFLTKLADETRGTTRAFITEEFTSNCEKLCELFLDTIGTFIKKWKSEDIAIAMLDLNLSITAEVGLQEKSIADHLFESVLQSLIGGIEDDSNYETDDLYVENVPDDNLYENDYEETIEDYEQENEDKKEFQLDKVVEMYVKDSLITNPGFKLSMASLLGEMEDAEECLYMAETEEEGKNVLLTGEDTSGRKFLYFFTSDDMKNFPEEWKNKVKLTKKTIRDVFDIYFRNRQFGIDGITINCYKNNPSVNEYLLLDEQTIILAC